MKFVLVFIDTLRSDHLGCYGYDVETSTNIDKLADESTLFEEFYATDVPTQPSFTSTFSGQRGIVNGVVTHAPHEWLRDDSPWLPSILEAANYTTAAVSTLYHMKPYFARGYDYYMNPVAGTPRKTQRVSADEINSYAIPWIREHSDEDFFLFLHYWDVHEYKAPEEYRRLFYDGDEKDPKNRGLDEARKSAVWPFLQRKIERIQEGVTDIEYVRAQYDAAIRYVDDRLGQVFIEMEDVLDDALLVVTSDHGESLGEHSIFFDHASVYQDTIHVPLIIRWPHSKVKKVGTFVQHIDLAPTVLELAGLQKPQGMQGESLVPILEGRVKINREVAYVNQGAWQAKRAIIADGWKYTRCIHHGFWPCPPEELYDLSKDPGERAELSEEMPQVLDRMAIRLRRWEDGQLGKRIDPLLLATEKGLSTTKWVWDLVKGKEGDYHNWARSLGW